MIPAAPTLSALESIGRSRQERWHFWELWAGCAEATRAVMARGLSVGPSVDCLPATRGDKTTPRLVLDLLRPQHRELIFQLLQEARPRWVHLGPPCTYWTPLGRLTACRTDAEWCALHSEARDHVRLATAVGLWQVHLGAAGSFEQPPRCASWRKRRVRHLPEAGYKKYAFRSCAWGHRNPGSGRPWQKRQCFAATHSLEALQIPCVCPPGAHDIVQGVIDEGPRRGERCSTVAGEYPPQMCAAFAAIVENSI